MEETVQEPRLPCQGSGQQRTSEELCLVPLRNHTRGRRASAGWTVRRDEPGQEDLSGGGLHHGAQTPVPLPPVPNTLREPGPGGVEKKEGPWALTSL